MTASVDGSEVSQGQEQTVTESGSVEVQVSSSDKKEEKQTNQTVQNDQIDPKWLASRLDREKKKLLRELGVESEEEVKKAVARAKELEEASKTELEKLREQNEKLRKELEVSKDYKDTVAISAQKELSKLSDSQRAYVESVAGDDPVRIVKTIDGLISSGLLKQEVPVDKKTSEQPVTPPPAPPKVLANTSSTGVPPKAVDTTVPKSPLEVWDSLKQANPFLAASFYTKNVAAILAEQEKTGKK